MFFIELLIAIAFWPLLSPCGRTGPCYSLVEEHLLNAPGQFQNVVSYGDGAASQSQNVVIYGDRAPGQSQNVAIYGDRAPGHWQSQNVVIYSDRAPGQRVRHLKMS